MTIVSTNMSLAIVVINTTPKNTADITPQINAPFCNVQQKQNFSSFKRAGKAILNKVLNQTDSALISLLL